jgi:hypothetical protein
MATPIRLPGGGLEMIPTKQELDLEFSGRMATEIIEFLLKTITELPTRNKEQAEIYLEKIRQHKERLARIQKQLTKIKRV